MTKLLIVAGVAAGILALVSASTPTTTFAQDLVVAKGKKGDGKWSCAEWLRRCNPAGHCNNPKARVVADCNHRGHALLFSPRIFVITDL